MGDGRGPRGWIFRFVSQEGATRAPGAFFKDPTLGRKSALLGIKLGNCILQPFEKTRLYSPFRCFPGSISLTPLFPWEPGERILKDFSLILLFSSSPLCFSLAPTALVGPSVNDRQPAPPWLTVYVCPLAILTSSSSRLICVTSSHRDNEPPFN